MLMRSKLNKWGNSWAIRVPGTFLKELSINPDHPLEINLDGQQIVIRKTSDPTLDELLEGVTVTNRHNLVDFDKPVGRELC